MDLNNTLKREEFNLKSLLISMLTPFGVGLLASLLSGDMRELYECLVKPAFAPAAWVFMPVWLILYFLMGLAAYRIRQAGASGEDVKDALFYYNAQLVFNFMWPILFFRFFLMGVALLDLIILIIMVMITTIKFRKVDKLAGNLMIPYLLWLIFAAVLNYSILVLNAPKG